MQDAKRRLRVVTLQLGWFVPILISAPVFAAAPTLGNLAGDSVTWANVGNSAVLDAGRNATPGDADFEARNGGNGDWDGATLTVQRAGTAVPADLFGFATAGAPFSVNGSNLESAGLSFANFSNAGGILTITFRSTGTPATTALVTEVVRRINYRNDTLAGDATIRFTLGDGTLSATADVTVTFDLIYSNGFE